MILESVLGEGDTKDGIQYQFYCPFCHHHKKKLSINLKRGLYHCWVCDSKGRNLLSLFKRINVPAEKFSLLKSELKDNNFYININEENENKKQRVFLPDEFRLFKDLRDPFELNSYNFLTQKRNITDEKIKKYNIGYCDSGIYKNRIIIPSYDRKGTLNYFVARSIYKSIKKKYMNPKVEKEFFPFELYTSFAFPIVFVEGVFDAINIDFNSVPLLGNTVSEYILDALVFNNVQSIYLFLDGDAKRFLYRNCKKFIEYGIDPIVILPPGDKDPGEITQEEIENAFKNKLYINENNLSLLKGI